MKIAYVVHWSEGEHSGVFKKVVSQTLAWQKLGAEVGVFIFSRQTNGVAWQRALNGVYCFEACYRRGGPSLRSAVRRMMSLERLTRQVQAWAPDIIYTRQDLFYPPLHSLFGKTPTVIEVNTDDINEFALGHKAREAYNRLTRPLVLRRASGLVFVSNELQQCSHFARYSRKGIVIGNAIDLSQFTPFEAPRNPSPRLVFVGTTGPGWHGLDKIVWLARMYPEWEFDLVGVEDDVRHLELPTNVRAHPLMVFADYAKLLARADAALGTLALHRKGMDEASSLKVREYLACGIPTIMGHQDTDFPNGAPFLLSLPNCQANVQEHHRAIADFVNRRARVPREAILHLDVMNKEARRLRFFSEFCP